MKDLGQARNMIHKSRMEGMGAAVVGALETWTTGQLLVSTVVLLKLGGGQHAMSGIHTSLP
jgi:hypothetical protein